MYDVTSDKLSILFCKRRIVSCADVDVMREYNASGCEVYTVKAVVSVEVRNGSFTLDRIFLIFVYGSFPLLCIRHRENVNS